MMQKRRVILDKFSFATDEIAAREDPAWSCGPSGAQFESYLRVFESVAAGTRFASIDAVVNGLLFKQVSTFVLTSHNISELVLIFFILRNLFNK